MGFRKLAARSCVAWRQGLSPSLDSRRRNEGEPTGWKRAMNQGRPNGYPGVTSNSKPSLYSLFNSFQISRDVFFREAQRSACAVTANRLRRISRMTVERENAATKLSYIFNGVLRSPALQSRASLHLLRYLLFHSSLGVFQRMDLRQICCGSLAGNPKITVHAFQRIQYQSE